MNNDETPSDTGYVTRPADMRGEKLHAYQQHPTIQEILLVDSRKRMVEHHHRIGPAKWEVCIYTQEDDTLELASLDVSLSVKDI